ncbi:MAG: type II secretion system F family protein [archaeon]|jgi:flagellar protein FlaJ
MEKEKLKELAKKSFAESALKKKLNIKDKELEKHKLNCLKNSLFLGLFCWLGAGVLTKNILLSLGIGLIAATLIFVLLLQAPLAKKKAYAKKVEAELPLFLMQLSTEISIGKSFFKAIEDSCKEQSDTSKEFALVLQDMKKGASFSEALEQFNKRMDSLAIRRVCSNLSNLQTQGSKDTTSIKKLAQEMLLKQRIESKEFSGKMVVYALVFIAISAIVPAMFQSFILIGSYFMKLSFTAPQVFLISVILFPIADLAVLLVIDSKTPIFLKG